MGWTKYQIGIAILMVITGSINTIATKWADLTVSVGSDGTPRPFDHPFLQATSMFFGEFLCFFAFIILKTYYKSTKKTFPSSIEGNSNFNKLIFLAPAMCDMIATSIMYIGLNMTYASSFQMLRGSVIIFTGLLSVAFLGRKLSLDKWIGIFIVLIGLIMVGVADFIFGKDSAKDINKVITGDLLIVIAQIIASFQMVLEEKFVSKNNVPPLQAVGLEGFFGFFVLGFALIPMYFIPAGNILFHNPGGQLEDAIDGFTQIGNSWEVSLGITGTILSIAFFNFAGISVTKEMSATTRMVLDSVRTLFIWMFSLAVKWQKFNFLQLGGFVVLLVGMAIYNKIIPLYKYFDSDEKMPLVIVVENDLNPNLNTSSDPILN